MRLHAPSRARRARAALALLAVFGVLGFVLHRFYAIQVVESERYRVRSEENRFRPVPIPAPRGTITDREGRVVAATAVAYRLQVDPRPADSVRVRLERIAPHVGLDSARVEELLRRHRESPREALVVSNALTFEEVARLEERRADLPGIVIESRPHRTYPQGEAVAHLIGHVAEISRAELEDTAWAGYGMGRLIGKAGIERQYERHVGGTPGARLVEVDAVGRIVRDLRHSGVQPPQAGRELQLTLDVELQRFAARIFPKEKSGAVVAMVPSTGEILALYSHPTYDPNLLVGGVDPRLWTALNQSPARPLLNRTTHGIYPPGSPWKLATAIVGLEKGAITPATRFPLACGGGMSYANRYARCWKPGGHGSLDLAGAIAHSCNVYFYQLGIRLGLDHLAREGTRLGFSRHTGVDLPVEKRGTFPEDATWYRRRFGWNPTPSEVMSLSIGQGPNAQTPIRMAQFFSALAGDGTARTPHLARLETASLPVETDLKIRGETLRAVREGLARVMEPGGTAYMSSLQRWKMYGKTGTAQNTQDLKKHHAWFTGFAGPPDGEPEVVVAVVVEFGESGSQAAAPLAAKVADFYLNRKHGFPTDSLQTLRERLTRTPYGR